MDGRHENDGVPISHECGTGRLFGNLASFYCHRPAADFDGHGCGFKPIRHYVLLTDLSSPLLFRVGGVVDVFEGLSTRNSRHVHRTRRELRENAGSPMREVGEDSRMADSRIPRGTHERCRPMIGACSNEAPIGAPIFKAISNQLRIIFKSMGDEHNTRIAVGIGHSGPSLDQKIV
jgi:hypothetical protein